MAQIIKIYPSIFHRKLMRICFLFANLQFILFYALLIHFIFYPLPFMTIFPSLVASQYQQSHYVRNALLYSIFYVQHILMALIPFKKKLIKINKNYILFERFIYNFASMIALILSLSFICPLTSENAILFQIPCYANLPFCIIGLYLYFSSVNKLGGDLVSQFSYNAIKNNKYLEHPVYDAQSMDKLIDQGIYGICRHPMQLSFLLLFSFGSSTITIDRLIFIGMQSLGITIGVYFQEKRLKKKFKDYEIYKENVKYGLIPYII